MKKKVLYLVVAALLCLSACGEKGSSSTSSSVTEASLDLNSQLVPKSGTIDFQKLVEAAPRAIQTNKAQEKLYSAKNGVIKTVGAGDSEEVTYRLYQVPDTWQLEGVNSETQPRDAVYRSFEGGLAFGVQVYSLDVYLTSPLSGGEVMKQEELAQRLKADGQNFIQESTVAIEDQEWRVGYEVNPDNNAAKITFYRLEDTGNYDDSVIVGAIIYPLSSEGLGYEEAVLTTVSQLKTILHQLAGQRETETVPLTSQ